VATHHCRGVAFAASALYRMVILTADVNDVTGIAAPLAVDAVAIALVFLQQITGVAAQALPANRTGVGGAVR
jgi:hypothetical protein